jgi:hypothetical protein
MENGIKEKTERLKLLADTFLKEDMKVFIKDFKDNIYFADIVLVGESSITFYCFGPTQRAGRNFTIYWPNIENIEPYRDPEDMGAVAI